jgi:predicted metal-dependent phosphoesterase TrpH
MLQVRAAISPLDRVDFHLHTRSSDGGWITAQLVDYLADHDFKVVAVCDHDTMRSVPEFMERASDKGMIAIPGVEFTTWWDERQWHLLVYGIEPNSLTSTGFGTLLTRQQANLRAAAERAISLLEENGHKLPSLAEVIDGRPLLPVHVLQTVIKDGHATNLSTAHKLVIKYGEDLRVDTPLEAVVEAAHQAGGTCVIAHPGRDDGAGILTAERLIKMLASIPIDGLEGHYRSYTVADTALYRGMALKRHLLISSGSDSHAPGVPVDPRPHLARWVASFLAQQGIPVAPFDGEPWTPGAAQVPAAEKVAANGATPSK